MPPASARHYRLVCIAILCNHASTSEQISDLIPLLEASQEVDQCTTREEILERCAVEICGIAFTANSPPVVVNCFGPIAFCQSCPVCLSLCLSLCNSITSVPNAPNRIGGPFIRDEAAQQELVRRLMACKRTIGWPVQRLVADLQLAWGEAAGQQIAV